MAATENSRARRRGTSRPRGLAGLAPAEVGAEDLGDARGDGGAAVGQLLGEARPAGQDVVERQRQLVAGGPGDLGLEERPTRDERPEQVQLRAERDDAGASVPCRATSRAAVSGPTSRDGRDRRRARRRSAPGRPGRRRRPAAARPCRSVAPCRFAGPRTASMTSRAMTRYVVYLPPPIRTTPFASTVTRCSRDALTVDPSDGAMSGRSPAYVPTTSARGQVDVHRRVDRVEQPVDLPAGGGRAVRAGPRTARRSCRSASGRATARGRRPCPGRGWSGRSCSGSAPAARRGGRRGSAGCAASGRANGWSGSAAQTPVASTTARVGMSSSAPVVRSSASSAVDARRAADRSAGRSPGPG